MECLQCFVLPFFSLNAFKLPEESLLRSFMFSDGVSDKNILV